MLLHAFCHFDNLISGISVYLVGPAPLKLLFQAFIVIVGFLMLTGAVNTAVIKEVVTVALARLAEDLKGEGRRGVLEQMKGLMHSRSKAERAGDEEENERQKGAGAAR